MQGQLTEYPRDGKDTFLSTTADAFEVGPNAAITDLVVLDRDPDMAAVLRAVLEPRGVRVQRQIRQSATDAAQQAATLYVLDVDALGDRSEGDLDAGSEGRDSEGLVLVGRWEQDRATNRHQDLEVTTLAKPFQYADLIAAVEHALRRAA
jgi:DNA-binding NtrC family response regulator